ncbi:RNA polymerase sigma factor [Niastella sp. OAS944]|uniref:RNA polymerase sigma factor n=1 Tax=Niastella sp. OAS944 TaxID=2664089 RepID=UPI00346AAB28|nr:RNA polymerase sigma-70 factor (ECF subfamily) [Chitinophagaceae bacterium OAS944]
MMKSDEITGNLFREESGRLLASVIHLLGAVNLNVAEDIVQDTMMAAVNQWRFQLPENPRAWLYRVVKNKTIDFIRQKKKLVELSPLLLSEWTIGSEVEKSFSDKEIKDNQLRMMFASCHPELAKPAQIAFILKTLFGLSVKEISRVFLSNEETITKRLYRAREKFRQLGKEAINVPAADELPHRLQSVLKCIYLIFTESYFSLSDESVMRKDLCSEAIYLCENLALHPVTASPQVYALLALMCFHASRFDARINAQGEMLTFEEQDRNLWNSQLIQKGADYLNRSMAGDQVTAYHIEAMIAANYSLSASAASIDWLATLWLYDQLLLFNASAVVKINRAYVLSKIEGPTAAIKFLLAQENMNSNLFYHIMLGELYKQDGRFALSRQHFMDAGKLVTIIEE